MAVIKYKNPKTEKWETVSFNLKGTKGDKGDPGVYVGSGDMPEGYSVQIDPDGDVYDIINEIDNNTNRELPTCEAVKNYVTSILDDLGNKLQDLLDGGESNVVE